MNRLLVSIPLVLTLAAVACFSADDAVVPASASAPTKTGKTDETGETSAKRDAAAESSAPAAGCSSWEDAEGTPSYGCCLPTGRCGYYVVSLNACVEASQIGATETNATCTYEGDGSDDDDDKDKDDDDDDKDKDDDHDVLDAGHG